MSHSSSQVGVLTCSPTTCLPQPFTTPPLSSYLVLYSGQWGRNSSEAIHFSCSQLRAEVLPHWTFHICYGPSPVLSTGHTMMSKRLSLPFNCAVQALMKFLWISIASLLQAHIKLMESNFVLHDVPSYIYPIRDQICLLTFIQTPWTLLSLFPTFWNEEFR